ncbi:hypothetical protein MP638_005846 [Amoeboaphelidium occidentale]|nr:hypothetical protein MP638_005846 [Amoeboaphelidium occidentale]
MTADTLPGKPIYNTDIPKFITNTVAKESHLNSTGFKLKQKWQGVKERKTALHQTDQQLERLQEKENKKKTEEDGLYGNKEASFRLRGETPVKTTATMMASKTPLKHFGSPALQTPSQQLQQQQLDKSGKLLYNFTKRPSPSKDSPSITAAATKSTRKALKVVERLKRGAVSDKTPLRMMGMEDKSKKISADTPSTRAVRRRNAVRNQMEKIEDAQSDSEDDRYVDISSSEGDNSENDNENESPAKRRAMDIDIEEEDEDSDKDEQLDRDQPMKNYFNAYKGKTSDTTLTELNDILTYQEFMKLLPQTLTSSLGTTAKNDNGKNTLLNHYRMSFDEWFVQLKAGFNLAFYGFGSKKAMLDQFAKQWLQSDGHVITLNGFSPVLNYRQLLLSLYELIVSSMYSSSSGSSRSKNSRRHAESPTGQIPQITSALLKELQKYHNRQRKLVNDDDADADHNLRDIYLVVHNIDGPLLRNEKIQSSLSELSEYIHLIVSLDHTQSSFLWDAYQFHNFHFLFHDLTTYKPYTEESLSDEGVLSLYGKFFGSSSIRRGGQATSTVTGAIFVLNSLTQNAKQVFKVLSRLQLRDSAAAAAAAADDHEEEEGISLEQLLTKCKEAFVCQTLQNLKMHLREFQDHQLVHERISDDGVVYLLIPFKQNQLKEILECCGLASSSSSAAAAAAEGDEGDETDQE